MLDNDDDPKELIICNTHLFWNPFLEEVKYFEITSIL